MELIFELKKYQSFIQKITNRHYDSLNNNGFFLLFCDFDQ